MCLAAVVAAPTAAVCAAQAMRVMNKRMNLPNMQKILMEFEKQNERMDMTSEMMGDAIDDAMEVQPGEGDCSSKTVGVAKAAASHTAALRMVTVSSVYAGSVEHDAWRQPVASIQTVKSSRV